MPSFTLASLRSSIAGIALFALQPSVQAAGVERLVDGLQRDLFRVLGEREPAALDLALVMRAEGAVSPSLQGVVGRLLVSRLAHAGLRTVQQVSPATPKALCRRVAGAGFELLLDATLSTSSQLLHLRGEVHDLGGTLWRELVWDGASTLGHVHANVPLDDELRAFSGRSTSGGWRFALTTFECPSCPVLALSACDIDRDGRDELLLLGERTVSLARFAGPDKGFEVRQSAALPGVLAPIGPRRPVGTIVVLPPDPVGGVAVLRSSLLARAYQLRIIDGKLSLSSTSANFPLAAWREAGQAPPLTAELEPGIDRFDTSSLRWRHAALSERQIALLPPSFYRLKATTAAAADGEPVVGVVDLAGRLALFDAKLQRLVASLQTVGVAFDLGDIDRDGALDVIGSAGSEPDAGDGLAVHRLAPDGRLALLWRTSEVDGRVLALTHGDFDGDGRAEVLGALQAGGGNTGDGSAVDEPRPACSLLQLR